MILLNPPFLWENLNATFSNHRADPENLKCQALGLIQSKNNLFVFILLFSLKVENQFGA